MTQSLITRLREAEFCNKSLFMSVCEELDISLHKMVFDGRTTLWTLIDARAWESAALALVAEVLPGWDWTVSSDEDGGGALIERGRFAVFQRHAEPAIAVCLALLQAQGAQDERR